METLPADWLTDRVTAVVIANALRLRHICCA